MEVPVRPHGPCSGMASHLRIHGWRWDAQLLLCIVAQLANEDINDPRALRGLDVADINESASWPTEVYDFIQKLCQVHSPLRRTLITCLPFTVKVQPVAGCDDEAVQIVVRHPAPAMPSMKRPRLEQVAALGDAQTTLLNVANARPMEALAMLERHLPEDSETRNQWSASARVAAVMGSCPRSLASLKSGLKHWIRFMEIIHGPGRAAEAAFPPSMTDVLA